MHNSIGFEMLPFVMQELVTTVMKKKSLPMEDALYYIYSSKLYETLINEDAKTWYLSTISIYDLLEKEKAEKRKNREQDLKVVLFKMFCIENFRAKKKMSAAEALLLFSEYDVFPFLSETFEMLHTQADDYIVDSISIYIKRKKRKR